MVVAYGILAVAASARSLEQLATCAGEAPVAYGLSAASKFEPATRLTMPPAGLCNQHEVF